MHGNHSKMVSGPGLVPFTTEFGGGGFGDERRRIHIRPIQTEDAPPLFAAVQESLEQLRAWMTWCGRDYAFEHCQSFVSNAVAAWDVAREFSFVILDSADGTLLGSVGINQANHAHNFANLGYWVRGSRTCRGVASAAVKLVARFGFQELGLTRLELLIPTKNLPSQRVAVKAGAQREGILRQRLLLAGELHDAVLYSLVPGDLQSEEQDCHSVAGVPA